jgi:hypothetical protein
LLPERQECLWNAVQRSLHKYLLASLEAIIRAAH